MSDLHSHSIHFPRILGLEFYSSIHNFCCYFYSPRAHVPDLAPTSVVGRAQQKYPQRSGGVGVFSMVAMVAKLSLMQYKIHKNLVIDMDVGQNRRPRGPQMLV